MARRTKLAEGESRNKQFPVSTTVDIYEKIAVLADFKGVSINELVNQLMKQATVDFADPIAKIFSARQTYQAAVSKVQAENKIETAQPSQDFLTYQQAAEYFSQVQGRIVTAEAIRARVKRGSLKKFMQNGKPCVSKAELEALFDSNQPSLFD